MTTAWRARPTIIGCALKGGVVDDEGGGSLPCGPSTVEGVERRAMFCVLEEDVRGWGRRFCIGLLDRAVDDDLGQDGKTSKKAERA